MTRAEGHLDNPKVQAELAKAERRRRQQQLYDLESVLKTEAGRRWFYRVLFDPELGALECGSFDHGVKDGMAAALHDVHHQGVRSLARAMQLEAQEACPRLYLQMINDAVALQIAEMEERQRVEISAGDKPS